MMTIGGARPWLVIVAAALAVGAQAACRRNAKNVPPPPPPALGTIEIQDVSPPGEGAAANSARVDTDALAAVVRNALLKSGVVVAPAAGDAGPPAPGVVRVRGRVGLELVEVEAKGLVRAAVALNLATKPKEIPGALNEDLSAASEQPFEVTPQLDRHAVAQRLVERTVGDLVGGYVARAGLSNATPEQLHAAIVSDGGALREEAIRISGARALRAEVPTLLPLLQDNDERIRDAALGALIAMREQRAVTELTRNRSLRDRHEMRKVLEAIAILGGDEARDYLSFVAASHDDEEIRKLAADAKERLERRSGAKSP